MKASIDLYKQESLKSIEAEQAKLKDRENELKAREYDLDIRERKLADETSEMEHQRLRDQRKFNKVGAESVKTLESSKNIGENKD